MSTALAHPSAEEIGKFFGNLLGVEIDAGEASKLDPSKVRAVAKYADSEGVPRAAISCDIAAALKLGAALTLVPAGGVEDAVEADELPENLTENLLEIFNIGVNVFQGTESSRLAIGETFLGAEAAAEFGLIAGNETEYYQLDLERYGIGIVAITTL